MKHPWNPLETPLETCFKGLNPLWNTLETPLKSFCGNHETFLKHLANSLKQLFYTLLTISWNTWELKTALKLLWSLLGTLLKTLLKHPQHFHETPLKCSQQTPDTFTLKTFLQHPLNFFKTPWKLHKNSPKTSSTHP